MYVCASQRRLYGVTVPILILLGIAYIRSVGYWVTLELILK